MKILLLALIFLSSACDQIGGSSSDHYIENRNQFQSGGGIVRVSVYLMDRQMSEKLPESNLIESARHVLTKKGGAAEEMWLDFNKTVSSHDVKNRMVALKRLKYAVIFENEKSQKFFAILFECSNEDGHRYILVDGFGNVDDSGADDWWFDARSRQWDNLSLSQ